MVIHLISSLTGRAINMRLIHTSKFQFEEFFDDHIPDYAILSNRWGSHEVSYKEFLKRRAEGKDGLTKIRNCCSLAKRRGFKYMWIDTCCIDKKSSVELSEAVNSMYRWYEDACECYVHLSDVSRNN